MTTSPILSVFTTISLRAFLAPSRIATHVLAHEDANPGLGHRVAVIGAGTLDSLPHKGAVVTLLAVCNSTHREGYMDIVMVSIVGGLLALAVVIVLGSAVGSF
jgi:H+/gluconate symporter-like permease